MVEQNTNSLRIVMLGAGNVATILTKSLIGAGHRVVQVVSRSQGNAQELATIANCPFTTSASETIPNADIYIIAVSDSGLSELKRQLPKVNGVVVHTSGSNPISILSSISNNYGVFYPFQTFTKGREIALAEVPFCIEGSSDNVNTILFNLAKSLGGKPVEMDSEMRQMLHLAGVFSCNFVNHMLAVGQVLAQEYELDYNLLRPLINETISKALANTPLGSQTGPAVRGDSETIKKHVAILSQIDEDLRDLYLSLSTSIMNFKQ
jgi:predicted short-subunit dehydrogenase-like oxidoreductase (DUF2520 family)